MINSLKKFENNPIRAGVPVVIFLFLLLLIGSLFLFRERMLFIDPGFIIFTILNNHEFVISEHRYGAFISQIFPLIAGWIQCPIPVVMVLYSASFIIFYFTTVLFLIFKFRQYGLAILMACYFTLISSDVYFWPNNEVHQGMAWMFLFFGQWLSPGIKKRGTGTFIILIVTAFLAIFSHFIVILPMTFLWIYFIVNKHTDHWQKKQIIFLSVTLALIILVKYMLGSHGWYDGDKLKAVNTMDVPALLATFSSGQASTFIHYLVTNYWITILLFILGAKTLINQKNYGSLGLTVGALLIYFLLICITFPDSYSRELLFYMESQWMGFAVIAVTTFIYEWLPKRKPVQVFLIVTVIFVIRLSYLTDSVRFFHHRYLALEYAVNSLATSGHSKIAVRINEEITQAFLMHWGLPIESLTLSMLKGYDPPVTIKVLHENEDLTINKNTFLSSFNEIDHQDLNPVYFKIDTSHPYHLISPQEFPFLNKQ